MARGGDTTIKGFDGLRAIAVSMVVVSHLGIYGFLTGNGAALSFLSGGSGVNIFFALSGFLITKLLVDEHSKTGSISLSHFYMRRALRIFPLYFLVLGLTAAVSGLVYYLAAKRALAMTAVYLTNFTPIEWYSRILAHTWSLAVEEHFYLIWPLAILVLAFRWNRAVVLLCGAILGSVLLLNILLTVPELTSRFFIYRWTPIAGASIALGCLCALLLSAPRFARSCTPVMASPLLLILSLGLYAHSLIAVAIMGEPPEPAVWRPTPDVAFSGVPGHLDIYLQSAGAALFIAWVYLNQSSRIVAALDVLPLRYLGRISYGIYMWQGFFLGNSPQRTAGELWPPSLMTGFLCLAVVAPLSFHFFEQPILALKRRFSVVDRRLKVQHHAA